MKKDRYFFDCISYKYFLNKNQFISDNTDIHSSKGVKFANRAQATLSQRQKLASCRIKIHGSINFGKNKKFFKFLMCCGINYVIQS